MKTEKDLEVAIRRKELAISLSLIGLAAGAFFAVEVFHPAHSPNGWILAGIIFGAYGLMVFVFEAFSHE